MNYPNCWKLSDVIAHCQKMLEEHGDLLVLLDTDYDYAWAGNINTVKDYKNPTVLYAVLEGRYEKDDDRDMRPL